MRVYKLGKWQERKGETLILKKGDCLDSKLHISNGTSILTYTRSRRSISFSFFFFHQRAYKLFNGLQEAISVLLFLCYRLYGLDISFTSLEKIVILYFHANIVFLILCLYSSDQ